MADTLDLLSLAEGYRAINDNASATAGTGSYDITLAQWITAISRRIDDVCGPVVVRTITGEQHNGGGSALVPRYWPVYSVTTITEYSGTTARVLAAEDLAAGTTSGYDYWLDPAAGIIYRRSSGYSIVFGYTRVILTYVAGRYANTAAVDAKFKTAAAAILRRLWSRDMGAWARGGDPFADTGGVSGFFKAVDPMIDEFLGFEKRPPAVA